MAKVKARESALLVLQAEDVAPERGVTGNFRNAAWAPRDLQAYETLGKAKVKLIFIESRTEVEWTCSVSNVKADDVSRHKQYIAVQTYCPKESLRGILLSTAALLLVSFTHCPSRPLAL